MNRPVLAAVIGGMMASHATANASFMRDSEHIVQCLIDLAPQAVAEECWVSRVEEKGWPSVRVFFRFERSFCTDEDPERDKEIRLETAKETLTNLGYRALLLDRLRAESQGHGISSACGEKLYALRGDPVRYHEEFAPFAREIEPLVHEKPRPTQPISHGSLLVQSDDHRLNSLQPSSRATLVATGLTTIAPCRTSVSTVSI